MRMNAYNIERWSRHLAAGLPFQGGSLREDLRRHTQHWACRQGGEDEGEHRFLEVRPSKKYSKVQLVADAQHQCLWEVLAVSA